MDDLVRFLVIGLVVAAVLVPVVRWFWNRFDRPTEAQLEFDEAKQKKREEERMWRQIEAQMRAEEAAAEEAAALARKRSELASQAAPRAANVQAALGALGLEQVEVATTDAPSRHEAKTTEGADAAIVDVTDFDETEDDADLVVDDAAQVSLDQDRAGAPEPDWVLIDRLRAMTERDQEPAPADVPDMLDLDALDDDLEAIGDEPATPSTKHTSDLAEATGGAWEAEDEADDDGWDVDW
jgi:hypothetical protein